MTSIGPGVQEIRVRDESGTFRVIYLARLPEAVYVIHCFQKEDAAHAAAGTGPGPKATDRTHEDATMTSSRRNSFASVWDAIEDSREIAASLRLRAEVANAVIEEVRRRKLTQARAAAICGITQPRISDLMRGRLDLFSLDALIDMAAHLELRASVTVRRRRAA